MTRCCHACLRVLCFAVADGVASPRLSAATSEPRRPLLRRRRRRVPPPDDARRLAAVPAEGAGRGRAVARRFVGDESARPPVGRRADACSSRAPSSTVEMYESGQVLPRLAKGEMQIGLMSRPLTERELKEGGVVAIATAKDVLGIVVQLGQSAGATHAGARRQDSARSARPPTSPAPRPGASSASTGELAKDGRSRCTAAAPARARGATWCNRFLGEGAAVADRHGLHRLRRDLRVRVAKDRGGVGYVSLSLSPPESGKVLPLVLNTGEVIPAPKTGEAVDPRYPLVRELYVVLKWKQGEHAVADDRGIAAVRAEPLGTGRRGEGGLPAAAARRGAGRRAISSAGPGKR